MMSFKPKLPFNVPMKLLIPQTTESYGVTKKTYPDPETVSDDFVFFGSFRTFGGTEITSNDVYTIVDTATVDCWYRTDITANCRVYLIDTGEIWEIIGRPENIEMNYMYMQFKLKKIGGAV